MTKPLPKFTTKKLGRLQPVDLPLMRYRKQHLLEMIEDMQKELEKIAREIDELEKERSHV
jgi:hypothetical protein